MKHLIFDIERFIKTNFAILETANEEYFHNHPENRDIDKKYFFKKNRQLFYLPPSTPITCYSTLEKLPWVKTNSYPKTTCVKEIVEEIYKYSVVLITDESDSAIGYIEVNDLLINIFRSYEYLKAYFDSILETLEESVSIIDENGNTVIWTHGAEKIYSIKKEEIIGKPLTDFFAYEKINMTRVLKTGEKLYRYQSYPRDDMFLLVNINPIELDGNIIGVVGSESDISNEIRLHQELFKSSKQIKLLKNEVNKLAPPNNPFYSIKGSSYPIRKAKDLCIKIASTSVTCLIQGESGVGKELFAKAIHDLREKLNAPFIAINCGAITPTLLESELFGYEKGAFSGANQKGNKGKVELAQGGTLFLDEVGEMPLDMQVKLLRVLQEKKYFPVGGTKEREVDFRLIAATHRDLEEMIKKGEFREDLYYRLNVINLKIPSLRERPDDILELTKHFFFEFSLRYNKTINKVPDNVLMKLMRYSWPGNIRELKNIVERLVVYSTDGKVLEESLPFKILNPAQETDPQIGISINENNDHLQEFTISTSLQDELELHEKKVILKALSLEKGNKITTAQRLGISRSALYYKLNKLGID